jgi:O-antigen/teichoic acid export membrane protein
MSETAEPDVVTPQEAEAVIASYKSGGLVAVLQSTGARAIFILINALTGILTARVLHPGGRGELAAIAVWPNFLPNLMTLGLPSALIYRLREGLAQRVDLIRASLYLTVMLGFISTVFGVVCMPYWLTQYSPHIVHLAQLFMINGTVVLLIAMLRGLCESNGDFFASSVSFALTPLVSVFVLAAFYAAHSLTPATAALAYVAGGIPTVIFLFRRVWGDLGGPAKEFLHSSRLLLSFGIRSYGVDLCGTLSLYADQALVVRLLNPAAMGIYVVALSLSRTLNVMQASVASILFPRAVNLELTEMLALVGKAVRLSTAVSVVAGIFVAILGPVFLPLLYGKDYGYATVILDILIVEAILSGATLVLTQAYMALGKPGLVTILQTSGLLISIPLLMVLIPPFGIVGASCALLIAALIRITLTLLSFRFYMHLPTPSLIPKLDEFRNLFASVRNKLRPATA